MVPRRFQSPIRSIFVDLWVGNPPPPPEGTQVRARNECRAGPNQGHHSQPANWIEVANFDNNVTSLIGWNNCLPSSKTPNDAVTATLEVERPNSWQLGLKVIGIPIFSGRSPERPVELQPGAAPACSSLGSSSTMAYDYHRGPVRRINLSQSTRWPHTADRISGTLNFGNTELPSSDCELL